MGGGCGRGAWRTRPVRPLGLENFFFLITSPSRGARVARRTGLALPPAPGPPLPPAPGPPVSSWRDGPSWIPGLEYRGEVGRIEGGGEIDSGQRSQSVGWRSTGSGSTVYPPSGGSGVWREPAPRESRPPRIRAPTGRPCRCFAGRLVPAIFRNKVARPGCPLAAASAFTAAGGMGLRQSVSPATWRLAVLSRDRGRGRGAPPGSRGASGAGRSPRLYPSHRPLRLCELEPDTAWVRVGGVPV